MRASHQGSFDFNDVTQMKQIMLEQGSDTENNTAAEQKQENTES